MISFAEAPLIVRINMVDPEEGYILLFGVEGRSGLVLYDRRLHWEPLDDIEVIPDLNTYEPVSKG